MQKISFQSAKSSMCHLYLVRSLPSSVVDIPNINTDYHHDILNPSSIPPSVIIQRADAIWKRRGIRPKQHLSEPRPGAVTLMEKRAHADRCQALPPDLPDDIG